MILSVLKDRHELALSELCKSFEVSERTIRNDLQELNQLAKSAGTIMISSGKVYVVSQESFSWLLKSTVEQSNYYQYKLSAEERRAIVALILLCSEGYVTISHVADKLSVSKSTISSELKEVKELLSSYKLNLRAKTKFGFEVVGEEDVIRSAILTLSTAGDHSTDSSDAYRLLVRNELEGRADRGAVCNILIEWERENNLELTDGSFLKMETYLVLIVNRLLGCHILKSRHLLTKSTISNRGYTVLAADLLSRVCSTLCLGHDICEAEITALAQLLANCRYIKHADRVDDDTVYIQMQISAFVSDVCRRLEIDQQMSFKKYYSMLAHIDSTMRSIRSGHSQMRNPLRKELEDAYPQVFDTIRHEVVTLNRLAGKELGEDEISFIAMYIIAVVEEIRRPKRRIKAILVCSAGMCTALLLQTKLLQHFDIEVVEIISLHTLSACDLTDIDLIISTVWVERTNCPTICISPLLNDNDMDALRSAIENESMSLSLQRQNRNELQLRVCNYIREYQQIVDRTWNATKQQRRREIEDFYCKYFDQSEVVGVEKHPYELLQEDLIELNLDATDWRDAIRKTGKLLLCHGDIEARYIEHMIQNVEELGPYIVFIPHVAMAHSAANHGSSRLSIAFARLQKGVPFGHDANDPVNFVVCISVGKERDHLFPVFQLIKLFQNQTMLDYLLHVTEKQQVIDIIKLYELQKGLMEHENT